MANLIDQARALANLNNRTLSSDEAATVDALIAACSGAIVRHCRREFVATKFDELYHGVRSSQLILRQFPIIGIDRVAYGPTSVLNIINTSAANQRATLTLGTDGITLLRVASGAFTSNQILFAGNVTIAAVAAAVNAVANGWLALIPDANYANWPSSDLRASQGAMNAKSMTASLMLHANEISNYDINAEQGLLYRTTFDPFQSGYPELSPELSLEWFGGRNYWRVIYTAGFAAIPDAIQEACAQWVAILFWLTKRDAAIANQFAPTSTGSTGTAYTATLYNQMPGSVKTLIDPYRKHRV